MLNSKHLTLTESSRIEQDEIYGDMVFRGNVFLPMATLTKTVPVIAVGGLAKQFLIPGWRVGWITVHDRDGALEDVRTAYFKLSQLTLGANSLVQVSERVHPTLRSASAHKMSLLVCLRCEQSAIPDLLTPVPGSAEAQALSTFKEAYYSTLEENAKFTVESFQGIRGLEVAVPQGAMYAMVSC